MKRILTLMVTFILCISGQSQKKWDGEAGDGHWHSATNWYPDGVPGTADQVILDQSRLSGSYTIQLDHSGKAVVLQGLAIRPAQGTTIEFIIPTTNTSSPALQLTGAAISLEIAAGGFFRNRSGAATGNPLQVDGNWEIRNGGHYIHETSRGNATLIDRLVVGAGSETGVFEFNVPGAAGYTVSLTGNRFGSLRFAATAAGGNKSYSGSGVSELQVKGHLEIAQGAVLTSTLSSDIQIGGDLLVEGQLHLNPLSGGSSGRSVRLNGHDQRIAGNGLISFGTHFREIECAAGSYYRLQRQIQVAGAGQHFRVAPGGRLDMGEHFIIGGGQFSLEAGATLAIGSQQGISSSMNQGNVQTTNRQFASSARYIYTGTDGQSTGDGLPAEIHSLILEQAGGRISLSRPVRVTDTLRLNQGILVTANDRMLRYAGNGLYSPASAYGPAGTGWLGSFVEGPAEVEIAAAGNYVLPLGKGEWFAPLQLFCENAGPLIFRAEYFPFGYTLLAGIGTVALHHVSANEHWSIKQVNGPTNAPVRVGLSWRGLSAVGQSAIDRLDLRAAYIANLGPGDRWYVAGESPVIRGDAAAGWLESSEPIPEYRFITLASRTALNPLPLPGTLILKAGKTEILLEFHTGTGEMKDSIYPEKSTDGRHFEPMPGSVDLAQVAKPYRFRDRRPQTGWNYYRMARAGSGGDRWSQTEKIFWKQEQVLSVSPVPADQFIEVKIPYRGSDFHYEIVNYYGQRVQQGRMRFPGRLDIGRLPRGWYRLMVLFPQGVQTTGFFRF